MDSLESLAALIRTLSRRTKRLGAQPSSSGIKVSAQAAESTAPTVSSLRERLRARLQPLTAATGERRRQAFVETVLLHELSETTDPSFAELVGRVTQELAGDPRISARLDELLLELPKNTSA